MIPTPGIDPRRPAWTPDSSRLVVEGTKDSHQRLYLASVRSGETRTLELDGEDDLYPSVSHDGRWVYFSSKRSGEPHVWRAPIEGGTPQEIVPEISYYAEESQDGKYLYYSGTS